MSELASHITADIAPPLPTVPDRLKFYGMWIAAALVLLVLPDIFTSGGSLTTFLSVASLSLISLKCRRGVVPDLAV